MPDNRFSPEFEQMMEDALREGRERWTRTNQIKARLDAEVEAVLTRGVPVGVRGRGRKKTLEEIYTEPLVKSMWNIDKESKFDSGGVGGVVPRSVSALVSELLAFQIKEEADVRLAQWINHRMRAVRISIMIRTTKVVARERGYSFARFREYLKKRLIKTISGETKLPVRARLVGEPGVLP